MLRLSTPDFTFLDIGVGFLALFSGAMSAHHEIMIAHLRSYQKILLENANPELASAWHHFQTEKLLQELRVSDWTQLFSLSRSRYSFPKTPQAFQRQACQDFNGSSSGEVQVVLGYHWFVFSTVGHNAKK